MAEVPSLTRNQRLVEKRGEPSFMTEATSFLDKVTRLTNKVARLQDIIPAVEALESEEVDNHQVKTH
jgi:hypothetical protein